MVTIPYIFLTVDHKDDARRIKEALKKAGITEKILTQRKSVKESLREQMDSSLCWIEYISSITDPPRIDAKQKDSLSSDIPHFRIVSREIESKGIASSTDCIVFREPKKKQDWHNLASCINLAIRQQEEIQQLRGFRQTDAYMMSEEIQRLIFDCLSVGIIHIDSRGKIIDASSWFIDRFSDAVDNGKIVGQELTKSEIGRSLGLEAFVQDLLSGHDITDPDYRVIRGGYEQVTRLSIQARAIYGPAGEVTGALIMMEDLEETRDTLQKITELQSLETVGSLTGSLALELSQLLNIIWDHAKYLTSQVMELDPARGDLIAIENASGMAAELIQRLSAVTNVTAPEYSLVDINQAIRDVAAILNRVSDQKIAFAIELEPKLKAITADKVLIQLMLINLLSNASEAMPQGGLIRIRTGSIQGENLAAAGLKNAPHGAIWLSIQDSGMGMTSEARGRACQAFYSTKDSVRHAGLGLAVVRKAVQESNGTINIESQPGRGSTVTMYFPITPASSDRSSPIDSSPIESHRLVLLAEGEQVVRTMSQELLETGGYRVIAGANGKDTIDLFHEHRLDIELVIVDTALPDKRWQEVVEKIRSIDPEARILLTSGNTTETNIREAITCYQVGFIQKPFRMNSLLEKISVILDTEETKV
jgi:signal transduction histidine kinase/ActR/RegA family two-component response regulator